MNVSLVNDVFDDPSGSSHFVKCVLHSAHMLLLVHDQDTAGSAGISESLCIGVDTNK